MVLTIVNIIVQSSMPKVPPQHLSRATIRRIKAMSARMPPPSPKYETSLLRSRCGAPQAELVTFLVAYLLARVILYDWTFTYSVIDGSCKWWRRIAQVSQYR